MVCRTGRQRLLASCRSEPPLASKCCIKVLSVGVMLNSYRRTYPTCVTRLGLRGDSRLVTRVGSAETRDSPLVTRVGSPESRLCLESRLWTRVERFPSWDSQGPCGDLCVASGTHTYLVELGTSFHLMRMGFKLFANGLAM
jgi:hypothetical protein